MRVIKILNNNLVFAENELKEDVILMGKAIGYNNKVGNIISPENIEKLYVLEDQSVSKELVKLMEETPPEYLLLTRSIVDMAEKQLEKKLFESIYITLTDHLHLAVIRNESGVMIQNRLLWEVRKFYPQEFEIGLKALKKINEKLDIHLPEAEAGNIAFHIVNAQSYEGKIEDLIFMTNLVKDVLKIINHHYSIELDTDSLNYSRFVTHLQFLAQRLLDSRPLHSDDHFLYDNIKATFTREFDCTLVIKSYIEKISKVKMTREEEIYLTIHLNRLLQ
ncbi:BglG family transcription antiterminator LicT [Alkalicoccobacillus murimartini]|uniref:Beta-glucoside operon transcriptional antiterminator n=1 Tax=Alkalicoccobacillus murimartini TaxID=171685 RepID=A0ABT9YHK9_9BACI|nr:PRD domain-containing protein [Alkalicoccobacillus murimartini]MDQ0207317.1 beta-glucoside operon transcriptional antiterminator [Alkalicoccobacillus murimartini]